MNKQFDIFAKMKITEMCKTIHDMTYTYINPDTKKPTDVPAKHYQDILKQPVEVMVDDQVKRQFLGIMFKQLKNLKEEEPRLFYESLLLLDIGKAPDGLAVNEEVALKMTAEEIVKSENEPRKRNDPKFQMLNGDFLKSFEATRDDDKLMAELFGYNKEKDDGILLS